MKTIIISLALLCLGTSGLVVAEPYADKVKITASTSEVGAMFIQGSKVPDRSAVNIPPYPGALILQTSEAGQMKMNDKLIIIRSKDLPACLSIYSGNKRVTIKCLMWKRAC